MKKIKLKLHTDPKSKGRGIGFYAQHLTENLKKLPQIQLVEKNPDIVHYLFFDLFYPTLPFPTKPTVITIHDITPLMLPHLYPKGLRGSLNLWRQWMLLQNTKAVITDSKNSQKDIHNKLKVPLKKITPIPLAADSLYSKPISSSQLKNIKQKYNLPEQFILYVGGVNPNKNIGQLVQACVELLVPLVLVGSDFTKTHPSGFSFKSLVGLQSVHPELHKFLDLKQTIMEHPLIQTPGFIPSADLAGIYRLATAYCQPSLYEGFGLPLLEAMSAECLIISSRISSLPELYPKDSITFNPKSPRSLKTALNKALSMNTSQKNKKIATAKKRSQDFSWKKTTQETLEVYSHILK